MKRKTSFSSRSQIRSIVTDLLLLTKWLYQVIDRHFLLAGSSYLSSNSIQTQYRIAIQLPIHPQPHLDWPVSSSLWIFSLWKMEKRYSSFFWDALWSADRRTTRNTVLSTSTRIFIETLKLDDMKLIISFMFYLTWVFRMQWKAKIRKPCSKKMISRSLTFTIFKQISQISIKISKNERKLHIL